MSSIAALLPLATLPAPSIAAAPVPDPILALVSELIETEQLLVSIEERRTKAERVLRRWDSRNPKPEMRDVTVGSDAEYQRWQRLWWDAEEDSTREALRLSDPNRDLKLAMSEVTEARRVWKSRRDNAARRLEIDDVGDAAFQTKERIEEIVADLADLQPVSFEGLAAKARAARKLSQRTEDWGDDLNFALALDIGVMTGELDGCLSVAA
ncbi:hypothetical protein ACVSQB_01955 [Bradyrhizobium elkanii]